MNAKRALSSFRAPKERDAENRTWEVVRLAYRERVPAQRRTSHLRPVLAFGAVVVAGAIALSPAGATVGRLINRALGVQHAAPALLSLPAPGRLLVSGPGGTWTVAADGSTRRLGPWSQASWSPHALYVTAASANQLAAVTPHGIPQWTLARPAVDDPRWYPPTGYRIAYLSGGDLRVVAGDGTGDHLVAAGIAKVAPAWRPAHPYQLAYVSRRGRVVVRDADTGLVLWSVNPGADIRQLAWSGDGERLLALSSHALRVFAANGALSSTVPLAGGARPGDAALSPDGRTLALVLGGSESEVVVENLHASDPTPRRVLAGSGVRQVEWSPNGKWLLISWPAANQWVFVRVAGMPRIVAVSRITQQFSAGSHHGFPQLEGWCCTAEGSAG